MKKHFKKVVALCAVCVLSSASAVALKAKESNEAQAFVGITYVASKKGASAEATAILGTASVIQGAIDGAVYGVVFGGPTGFVVGLVVGF